MASGGFRLHVSTPGTPGKNQDLLGSPSRRTTRVRKQPKKFGDFLQTPTKVTIKNETSSDEEMVGDSEISQQKPTALFSNDDVEGQDMFQFKSRHSKLDLQNKIKDIISNSPKVMESPKTPRKKVLSQVKQNSLSMVAEATPRHIKNMIKKRIIRELESDSAESDFSGGSNSDFVPDETENENETESSHSSENEQSTENEETPEKPPQKFQSIRNKSKTKLKDSEYFITPDNYFMMHSSKKIQTSDHTLARLKNFNLDENEAQDIQISKEHKDKIMELNKTYKHLFDRWLYVLSENFNIILYGIGSKRTILHQFQMEKLKDFPCVIINGFFPSLTIKSVLESIVTDLLGETHVPTNIGDTVNLIDTQLTESEAELFLIVHNIDGAMLRNAKAQATLASLAQIARVHLVATVDHINAPLLWEHSKLGKLKLTWWDATTFLPYLEESARCRAARRGGALQLSSLNSVYRSLTTNAKGIFNIIIQHQLENPKQSHYQGLPLKDLYSKSREQFLVSSDLALRAQLTEFLDHKLVKMKRTYDGSENLVIPIETVLLQQFLEQQKS